jgi:integrase
MSVQSIMGATEIGDRWKRRRGAGVVLFSAIRHPYSNRRLLANPNLSAPPLPHGALGALDMATIERRGKSWRAIVRRKGEPRLTATFPTKGMAQTWVERTEREIADRRASGDSKADTMTLAALIGWYIGHAGKLSKFGRSKAADLNRLKGYAIADRIASGLRTQDYVRHAEERRRSGAGPATVGNDLVWIRGVLKSARASLGLNASLDALADATAHLRSTRTIAKSKKRERRLRPGEEAALLAYFEGKVSTVPMADIVRFALATTRRQEEIMRIRWADVDEARGVCRLEDVKHPTMKEGNHREFRILPDALAIIARQPRTSEFVFPYNPKTIGALFTRAVGMLGIKDLRFHDLRHHATSNLFERGYAIHEVAQFTLHDSWATLKRYANLKAESVPER